MWKGRAALRLLEGGAVWVAVFPPVSEEIGRVRVGWAWWHRAYCRVVRLVVGFEKMLTRCHNNSSHVLATCGKAAARWLTPSQRRCGRETYWTHREALAASDRGLFARETWSGTASLSGRSNSWTAASPAQQKKGRLRAVAVCPGNQSLLPDYWSGCGRNSALPRSPAPAFDTGTRNRRWHRRTAPGGTASPGCAWSRAAGRGHHASAGRRRLCRAVASGTSRPGSRPAGRAAASSRPKATAGPRALWAGEDGACTVVFAGLMVNIKGPEAGRAIKLLPYERWLLANLFGFVERATGRRRFRQASIWVPKGNGKTTLAAVLGLCVTFTEDEAGGKATPPRCRTPRRQSPSTWRGTWRKRPLTLNPVRRQRQRLCNQSAAHRVILQGAQFKHQGAGRPERAFRRA